jgi:hypothetical protein
MQASRWNLFQHELSNVRGDDGPRREILQVCPLEFQGEGKLHGEPRPWGNACRLPKTRRRVCPLQPLTGAQRTKDSRAEEAVCEGTRPSTRKTSRFPDSVVQVRRQSAARVQPARREHRGQINGDRKLATAVQCCASSACTRWIGRPWWPGATGQVHHRLWKWLHAPFRLHFCPAAEGCRAWQMNTLPASRKGAEIQSDLPWP